MITADYFQLPYVSNSKLTELWLMLSGREMPDVREALAFGSLFDAILTEPHRINTYLKTLDGNPAKDFDRAMKMKNALLSDPRVRDIFDKSSFQKISIRQKGFEYHGIPFELTCKCKWDFYGPLSGDIKSTVATNQKGFEAACEYLQYYRARAWYMDIDNTDKDLIIGVSKVNYKIFFVPVRRDDEKYNKGKQQYTELAFKYWMLENINK